MQGLTHIDIDTAVQRKTDLYVELAGGPRVRAWLPGWPPVPCRLPRFGVPARSITQLR